MRFEDSWDYDAEPKPPQAPTKAEIPTAAMLEWYRTSGHAERVCIDADGLDRSGMLFEASCIARELGAPADPIAWTREQWAAYDARIAADYGAQVKSYPVELEAFRARERARREKRRRTQMLEEPYEWPRRPVENADTADDSHATIVAVKAWAATGESLLVLGGTAGCGKTTAAAYWSLMEDWPAMFLKASRFATTSRYGSEERARWSKAERLVLDDLGAEYLDAKGSFMVDLDELVDAFYSDRRRMLITTNCTPTEFKQRYGERVADRIREAGTWISVGSGSLRKKAQP
jgi:DNA replication protein DnaC